MKFFSYNQVLFDMESVAFVSVEEDTTCSTSASPPVPTGTYSVLLKTKEGAAQTISTLSLMEAETVLNEIKVAVKGVDL